MIRTSRTFVLGFLSVMFAAGVFAQSQPEVPQPISAEQVSEYGIRMSDTPSRDLPGYRKLERMLVMGAPPSVKAGLEAVAPDVEFVIGRGTNPDNFPPGPFDAVSAPNASPAGIAHADTAAWVHTYSSGIDNILAIDWVPERRPIFTNGSGSPAPAIAEHVIGLMMAHARQLHRFRDAMQEERWDRNSHSGDMWEVRGKTMLVLGLGAIGTQIAHRAHALGMRVIAVRNSRREGPDYVDYVGLSHEMAELASQADVVANALPLTPDTDGVVNESFFDAMKPTSVYISIGRGGTTNTEDLMAAINSGQIAGAGLDVTDPEPLPPGHPMWSMPEVIITPHVSGRGMPDSIRYPLLIENVRRYQAGEPLLNPVNIDAGY